LTLSCALTVDSALGVARHRASAAKAAFNDCPHERKAKGAHREVDPVV